MVEITYKKGDGQKYKERKNITKVVIHRDVDEIGKHAFNECSNLTEIDWGDSKVTKIGLKAFRKTGLVKIKSRTP